MPGMLKLEQQLLPLTAFVFYSWTFSSSGSNLNPFPTISRVSHKYIDHLCLHALGITGRCGTFRRFPSLAKNVCRFYVLEMRFGAHLEVSPKHGRSRSFRPARIHHITRLPA